MTDSAAVILWIVVLYVTAGLIIALAFVAVGAARLIGHGPAPDDAHDGAHGRAPVPMTPGARLLLIPGAVIFWPLVLRRWLGEPL